MPRGGACTARAGQKDVDHLHARWRGREGGAEQLPAAQHFKDSAALIKGHAASGSARHARTPRTMGVAMVCSSRR